MSKLESENWPNVSKISMKFGGHHARQKNDYALSFVGQYRIRQNILSDQILCSSDLCHLMLFCDIILMLIVIFAKMQPYVHHLLG